ncbi:YkgJ family cysteine cluster protein [Pelotalea chapellei]|uniref:DUF2716 domain-containing protein n=1 Tax=Pelotalea chapellei TaxID=44671 RepID=A0ABS5U7X5_9BACT|nr:YkgJ family cysteine cluster protein [Pelotalea chapellei]MBT1071774.1 DUF2716 domain-containing protein [Pelotalea chapellei]
MNETTIKECRSDCAACCIAPSISSSVPGMEKGKPAGTPCIQLTPDLRCSLFGDPSRPSVCSSLCPSEEMCGTTRQDALEYLERLEILTRP